MDLGLAGMLSGAGEAGSKALTMGQAQFGAERLQATRDQMDDLRQQRLMEHQERMQGKLLDVQGSEKAKDRALTQAEGAATRATQEGIAFESRASQESIAKTGQESHERISQSTQETQREIAKMSNAMHENVAKLQREMQSKQFDKTFTAAKMTAATTALKDLSDQMIHLNQAVSNPLADKTSPEYKSAVEVLQKAQRLHMVYQQQLAEMIASGPGGVSASPEFPGKVAGAMPSGGSGFKLDPSLAVTPQGLVNTPRTRTVPPPSPLEQEMMQRSLSQ